MQPVPLACSPGCRGQVRQVWLVQMDEVLQLPVLKSPGTSAAKPHTRPPPATAHCPPPSSAGDLTLRVGPQLRVGEWEGVSPFPSQADSCLRRLPSCCSPRPSQVTTGEQWGHPEGKLLPLPDQPLFADFLSPSCLAAWKKPNVLCPPLPSSTQPMSTLPCGACLPVLPLPAEGGPMLPVSQMQTTLLKIEHLYWYL